MATLRTFQDMLNEYLPNELMREELIQRDYILNTCKKDNNWRGGDIIVPFYGADASSVEIGQLPADTDIAECKPVRGKITGPGIEVWGSMVFHEQDLQQHDNGKIPEDTFLSILPDQVDKFMQYMKEVVSIMIGTGPSFSSVTDATNAATGYMVVTHIDRFRIGQKCVIDDGDSNYVATYVKQINVNTNTVLFADTRGGSAHNLSAYSVAQSAKFYHPGALTNAGGTTFAKFTSFRDALMTAALGGSDTIHGVTKTDYPATQSVLVLGSDITASNLLEKLFDAYIVSRTKCKGKAADWLMSYKHFGTILKLLEVQKGAFKAVDSPKSNQFGWTEITIASLGNGQALKCVAIQEWDDDVIMGIDWTNITFRSNGFFKKRKGPDGNEYFVKRATTGFQYIIDICLQGEMEYRMPGHNCVVHTISY